MPRPKIRAKEPEAPDTLEKVKPRCCVVCYNDFTPFPFDSEKWNSNMIKNFYIALNIAWSTSGEEDDDDEEVVYLPFCPQCHTKVSVMQTYQIELQNLQAKFNSVRNDLAFSVVKSIGKHTKDGPIVQIRQQIFEKWKLTFEEKQKVENIQDEVGLEYIAHDPSSRPHVCGIHFCNCQRGPSKPGPSRSADPGKEEVDATGLQGTSTELLRSINSNGNGTSGNSRKTLTQGRRSVGMNGGMPVLSKMVQITTSPAKGRQSGGRNSTSTVPKLIPFRNSFQQRKMKAFDGKFPVIPNLSRAARNMNLSEGGNSQKLQPPALMYVGHDTLPNRDSPSKFPGGILSKFNEFGETKERTKSDIQPRVPSHIVPKTPIRQPRKFGVRTTGLPSARQRLLMQGTPARNANRARLSGNIRKRSDPGVLETEIGPLPFGTPPKQGKRKISAGSPDFVEPISKQARVSGSLSVSPRRSGTVRQPISSNAEAESPDEEEQDNITRTRGSSRSSNKSLIDFMPILAEDGYYQCQWCPKVYSTLSRIRRHGSFEHPEKQKIQCEFESCNKGFTSDVAYKRHYQHQHKISLDGFITMTCSVCSKCFIKTSSFRTHLKSHGLSITEISLAVEAAEAQQALGGLPNYEGEDVDGAEDDEFDDDFIKIIPEVKMDVEGEENGVGEETAEHQVTKVKRKITIQRPFGIRKRKRRGKHSSPKIIVPPATTRRRNPKPVPVDPVRKSSRQRGVHIDVGLPMYPARRKRKNKDKDGADGDETQGEASEGVAVKDENNETETEGIESGDTGLKVNNESMEEDDISENLKHVVEPITKVEIDEDSKSKPEFEGVSDTQAQVEKIKEENAEDESNTNSLDDSFVRGAKSETTLSTSPIRMNMNEVFATSTPMVPKSTAESADLNCSMNNGEAATVLGSTIDESTFSVSCGSEDADGTDNGDTSAMNTTYTLESTGEGEDCEKPEPESTS